MSAGGTQVEVVRRLIEAENKHAVHRYLGELGAQGRIGPVEPLAASGDLSAARAPAAPAAPRVGRLYRQLRRKLGPDLHLAIEEQIAEGNTVMTRLLATGATGTRQEGVTGVPPAPRILTRSLILVHRFDQGAIAEERVFWDVETPVRSAGRVELRKPILAVV